MNADRLIRITDVAPRDGLQNEPQPIATADKAELVRLLAASGVDEVEVTSFVSPQWVPQLADAADVLTLVAPHKPAGVLFSALVPNARGMDAARGVNQRSGSRLLDKVAVFTSASETFSQRNTNATIAETLKRFEPVIASAHADGLMVRAYVSCAIRCPFEGDVDPTAPADVARRLLDLGADEIDVADTIGVATPASTRAMLETVMAVLVRSVGSVDASRLTLHLHDTFGRAAECVGAALELGVRSFDGAAAGLGGCPYASTPQRRAPGNIDTQVLLNAVRARGYAARLDEAAQEVAAQFAREALKRTAAGG